MQRVQPAIRHAAALAGVTGGSLTFSNNLERIRVIREDRKIGAADPTFASAQGLISVRFDGSTLVEEVTNGDRVALEYGFTFADGVRFDLPRVFLPKPIDAVSSPGGVEGSFEWCGGAYMTRAKAPCCVLACSTTSPAIRHRTQAIEYVRAFPHHVHLEGNCRSLR